MGVKQLGRYYVGTFTAPGQSTALLDELPDVRDDGRFGPMDCKYCYTDGVLTVSSYEHFDGTTVQALCAACGAGLTATEPVEEATP